MDKNIQLMLISYNMLRYSQVWIKRKKYGAKRVCSVQFQCKPDSLPGG